MESAAPAVRRDAEQSDRDGRAPLFRVHFSGLEFRKMTRYSAPGHMPWQIALRHRVQRSTRFESAEEAEQHERVEADAEPFLGDQVDQSIERVDRHAHDEAPGVTFVGEYAKENKDRRRQNIQHNSHGQARARPHPLPQFIEELRDSQSQNESRSAAGKGEGRVDKRKSRDPIETTATAIELHFT